jgi:hypothetical protein
MKLLCISILIVAGLASCKKEYENPPISYPDDLGAMTIDSLRQLQQAQGSIQFDTDVSVYGIITMDENDGNIYKTVYMQDHTGGINVRLLSGGGVYQGDSVRIALNGCYVSQYSGVLQLDAVNADVNIIKQSVANAFPPEVTTIDQITTAKESELVQFNNVQFVSWELDETFADKPNLEDKDRLLEDQNGNVVVVRTSGYSSFADQQLPQGSGSIVCIVNHFNGEIQLLIRSYNEIDMDGARFTGLSLHKDFNDDELTSNGWTTQMVIGTIDWETSTAGGAPNPYGSISNYNGSSNVASENWLISPSVDLTTSTTPLLSFDNAYKYNSIYSLELYISTDYVSGAPSTGTWVDLSSFANWSGGNFVWANSGDIDISSYKQSNVHIAFRYQGGGGSDGSTWELDNILIKG